MASDTAPPAVPAPHNPPPAHAPATGQQAPRGLAGLLAAVEPARPTFNLTPTPGDPATAAYDPAAQGGASSSDFNHDPTQTTGRNDGKTGTSSQQQGVLRTWMLALAKRHEQAGAARLKALDIRKAQATALQVKEQRTTNRSEKFVGGTTGTNNSTNTQAKADKNTGTRTNTSASKGDHKNHKNHDTKNNHTNQSGRGGAGGPSGGHGSSGAGRGNSGTGKTDTPKTNGSNSGMGGGGKSSTSGKDGSAGKPGKDGKTPTTNSGSGGVGGGSGKEKPKTTTSTCGDSSGLDWSKKPSKDKPKDTAPTGGKGGQGSAGNPGAQAPAGHGGASSPPAKPPVPGTPVDMRKTPDPKTGGKEQPKPAPDAKNTPQQPNTADKDLKKPTTPATGPAQPGTGRVVIDTQAAREAGYDAGTRIGGIEAQLGALRDGIRDGRAVVKEAAGREKARLDKAHADWKQQPPPTAIPPKPTQPPAVPPHPKDQPMTTAPATDKQTPQAQATPIQVNGINAHSLQLGDGAARQTISRGEVRTLKHFERALDARTATLIKAAENTKIRQAEATEYATKASRLLEQAKTVKGGDKLLATLTRLQETAQLQAMKAEETHRRAARAADTCQALVSNLKTRYEPLYQAVLNSPETSPAETDFYLGDHSA